MPPYNPPSVPKCQLLEGRQALVDGAWAQLMKQQDHRQADPALNQSCPL